MTDKQIVAKLGKVSGLLNALETLSETKGCATLIQDARLTVCELITILSDESKTSQRWVKVGEVILWLMKLVGCLKDSFKICYHCY